SAEALAEKVRKQVGPACPVYVRFYDPLWKVQAGDCTTRDQARSLQSFLQRSGHPDAWIVSSGINR
ncbi:MAG: SPOR domain-containing protein, partial [Candidatus Glassbacteria bacterium]